MRLHGPDEPVYTIGVAARLLGVNPQTLRVIEREGLLEPARTDANIRLYSENDLMILKRICVLVREEGVNFAGVKVILSMELGENRTSVTIRRTTISHGTAGMNGSDDDGADD